MMEINDRQMRLGYFAQCVSVLLRIAMEDDFDFMLTVKPIGKDEGQFKTVKVLCNKRVGEEN